MPSVKRKVGKNQDTFQSAKFKEAARELGCDEDPKAFERTFSKIVPPKKPASNLTRTVPTAKPKRRKRAVDPS
jgi:hypothetical protein